MTLHPDDAPHYTADPPEDDGYYWIHAPFCAPSIAWLCAGGFEGYSVRGSTTVTPWPEIAARGIQRSKERIKLPSRA